MSAISTQKRKAASHDTSSSAVDENYETTPKPKTSKKAAKKAGKKARKNNNDPEAVSSTILNHFSPINRRHSASDIGLRSTHHSIAITSVTHDMMAQPSPQKEITLNDIMSKLESNSVKMDNINSSIHRLESSLLTLQLENDQLKHDLTTMKKEGVRVKETADGARVRAEVADVRSNENEQYCRNYNLRIYNVPESKDETAGQCEEKVLKLFHEKLTLKDINIRDLDAVHRLGKRQGGDPRPIIVRFVSRRVRTMVISKRRLLKKVPGQTGRVVTIVEDLTKSNYVLYQRVRMTEATKECWTTMGKIFVKTKSGATRRITKLNDISVLEGVSQSGGRGATVSSQRPGSQHADTRPSRGSGGLDNTYRGRLGGGGGGGVGVFRGNDDENEDWHEDGDMNYDSENASEKEHELTGHYGL